MRAYLLLLIPFVCFAQREVEEEALSLRRIADFWQEGEYLLAKNQMEEYLHKYPDSAYYDTLCAALGDLCLREKNYSTALDYYSRILGLEWKDTVLLSRMQCLYYLQWYTTLADECEAFLTRQETSDANQQTTYYLAIALYQQCLNVLSDPQQLEAIALRARPYFTTLLSSDRSVEVSRAFAYLCNVLNEFPQAANIYLELAEQDETQREDFLFQAASIQAKFDKGQASDTFKQVFEMGQGKAEEATFNYIVLHFEMQRYAQLLEEKESLFNALNPAKQHYARLLFGQSHFHQKEYTKAVEELSAFIESPLSYETRRPGVIYLLAAAFKEKNLPALERAVVQLEPQDEEQPQAIFFHAALLKESGLLERATQRLVSLLDQYPYFAKRPEVLFTLAELEYQCRHWKSCRAHAQQFLAENPSHTDSAVAWRYLVAASTQLSEGESLDGYALKQQLIMDIEVALSQPDLFVSEERCEWNFLLAKACYEVHDYPKAFLAIEDLMQYRTFPQLANTYLLMALLRKGESPEQFCQYAEKALALNADLIDTAKLHIALFNVYLERSYDQPELTQNAADHLFTAFALGGDLQSENLDWLADYYYNQAEVVPIAAERAIQLLEKAEQTPGTVHKLAKLYSLQLHTQKQVSLLETNKGVLNLEGKFFLAEGYARQGKTEEAIALFDEIVAQSPTLRSFLSASASLQSVRLKQQQGAVTCTDAASCLKNLVLQRRLANEPIHLEAAIEYIYLQSNQDPQKQLALFQKTKEDFEATDNLLSQDYHESRQKLPEKDHVYQIYIRFFEANIYLCQSLLTPEPELRNELRAKAKKILLEIKKDPVGQTLLGERINERLHLVQVDLSKDECDV